MAKQALAFLGKHLEFESVTFVPAGNPPHRQGERGLLPPRQRFHLLEQAILGSDHLSVSPVELEMASEGQVTYTYNVLQRLGELSQSSKHLMLMGQDSFETLPDWYQGDELLKNVTFIVLSRPDNRKNNNQANNTLEKTDTASLFSSQPDLMASFVDYHVLQIPPIGISATYIRKICQQLTPETNPHQALTGLMPEPSLAYLLDNGLYKVWQQ